MALETAKKALVVEDSPSDRMLMRQILAGLGYTVTETSSGEEGLQAVTKQGPFNVTLLDWNMSGMSGLEWLKTVRTNASHKAMRVVMVTAECDMDHVRTALLAGANEYIMKPFSREMVNIKLRMLGLGG